MAESTYGETASLTKPIFVNGRFENPWKSWRKNNLKESFKFIKNGVNKQPPLKEEVERTLPIIPPDFNRFSSSTTGIPLIWIGHATVLVKIDNITVLADPIFSSRCSFVQFLGPKRYRDPPCQIKDLPKIDAVVISHNHYDHLDLSSVKELNQKYGKDLRWYVPQGMKKWMMDVGCENVVEMTWWDEQKFPDKPDVKFVCTPSQHWSKRGVTDTNKSLWCSWAVIGPKHSFYFAGDTGYCEGFKEIGEKYGPFTLSAIPIGCYIPREFLSPQHVSPSEAVEIHKDVKSLNSVGIHWGTFNMMAHEHYLAPREDLILAVEEAGLKPTEFVTVKHGELNIFEK
ncbi:N-acyl-phosphatidylethanolamine-hydrolyzing phospholipase D-like [Patella vulgata]|uniref:N-acyl-phosphatidylethanolamine-hydrolyzing phospholipase D-like n=1 Tax=Patella vulgata TaxID=6465 RepID=UPI00218023AD|nr:N-acyl-phosphatidylethanolamine-hydrolyzing phospholipase D-like [Patella vulgata]